MTDTLDVRRDEVTGRLVLSGVIDDQTTDLLTAVLHGCATEGPATLDLSEVEYLSSCGLAAFVTAMKGPDRGGITLVAREGCIAQRVLDMTAFPHRTV